jgi:hypothetical protein
MVFKIIVTFIFVIDNVLLYFFILRKINNGIIHFYFILMLVVGYVIGNHKTKTLKKN